MNAIDYAHAFNLILAHERSTIYLQADPYAKGPHEAFYRITRNIPAGRQPSVEVGTYTPEVSVRQLHEDMREAARELSGLMRNAA